jgi:hypothetical protein
MYKGIKNKGEFKRHQVTQTRCQKQPTACNKLVVAMGVGGSWKAQWFTGKKQQLKILTHPLPFKKLVSSRHTMKNGV